ncbi:MULTISPECIES: hypothetical protein [unclassified Streptomyces]|uniref:hypothetical protein n=1 Tax=unclassified Streptomyces TaxID=2593676 RepID=UPI00382EF7B5
MHLAWLLADLGEWVTPMTERHITVIGVDSPESEMCDVLLRDGDTEYRARIALARRKQPLDFPERICLSCSQRDAGTST